jgi:hypothetical protein
MEVEASARILFMGFNNRRLQLSFLCETGAAPGEREAEVTLVTAATFKPLFCALAVKSLSGEYSLEAELSSETAENWNGLITNDSWPFRLILHPVASGF